ncbi:unnamed protein product [Sphagnum balticum]
MVEALKILHSYNIVHRDLKLANILITDDYKLKLADFGFSKEAEGLLKSFCGTPLAMAPEILNRQEYDSKCDVWSLGVLTYMMIYNKPPFFPSKEYGYGILGVTNVVSKTKHKFDDKIKVSEEAKSFLNACLEKDPKNRPSMVDLLSHAWFDGIELGQVSKINTGIIGKSLSDES